jgi:hypothetical protein
MKTIVAEQAPPNTPSMLDRNRSLVGERLTMWLLGAVLLAICLVSSFVAIASPV